MLTSDLVRATVRSGRVRPRFVSVGDEALGRQAAALVALVHEHEGRSLGELEEAIGDHIGDDVDYLVRRGLVKLLLDRTELTVPSPRAPHLIREVVFEEAARTWPVGPAGSESLASRRDAVERAAARLEMDPDVVEASLFADRRVEQRLGASDLTRADGLLHRYNLALAQAVLLKARSVTVRLPDLRPARARQLLRAVKFHRLMHRAERDDEGWVLTLDGPLSLFRQTGRYGLQLALFLPALCHCAKWFLSADVVWGPRKTPCTLHLDHRMGLETHTKDLGTWESEEERQLRASWKRTDSPWSLRRSTHIIDLAGRGVLVPDYTLVHRDGRKAHLELVWYWRRKTFERRLALLREAGPPNLIVALATRLHAGEEATPDLPAGCIVPFKGVIQPKKIMALAEEVAC